MQYLFLVCITTLDVSLWAGTGERVLSQLRESEVGQVMSFLESNDPTIRILTTRLLVKIDPAIIEAYLSQYISTIPSPLHHALAVCENYAIRALEISGLVDDEGASYANRMTEILNVIQTPRIGNGKDSIDSVHASPKDPVQEEAAKATGWGAGVKAILEGAVEMVLDRLRVGELVSVL
ncbi:hypothetical protein FRC02_004974 [Tulasnella sp. 418]|nr:hypothetical protein FRC02_004974 [Tulasnella sp. 418]